MYALGVQKLFSLLDHEQVNTISSLAMRCDAMRYDVMQRRDENDEAVSRKEKSVGWIFESRKTYQHSRFSVFRYIFVASHHHLSSSSSSSRSKNPRFGTVLVPGTTGTQGTVPCTWGVYVDRTTNSSEHFFFERAGPVPQTDVRSTSSFLF